MKKKDYFIPLLDLYYFNAIPFKIKKTQNMERNKNQSRLRTQNV